LDSADNVLERVSPYLRRNQPLDILDLWPGGGIYGFIDELITRVALGERLKEIVETRIWFNEDMAAPLDILDLWPGGGLISSKVNELLQPRRHVLVEPDPRFNFGIIAEFSRFPRPCSGR
jgi:hypothetical protein